MINLEIKEERKVAGDGQYRVRANLTEHISNLEQVNDKLQDSLDNITDVIKILEGDTWKGQSKAAALDLLSIFRIFHEKLLELNRDNVQSMKELDDEASQYMNGGGSIPAEWR